MRPTAAAEAWFRCAQVSVVSFKKGQLQVKAHAWDRDLGGRDFDEVLFDYFVNKFDEQYKVDIRSSPRASFRLRLACEKVRGPPTRRHRKSARTLQGICDVGPGMTAICGKK